MIRFIAPSVLASVLFLQPIMEVDAQSEEPSTTSAKTIAHVQKMVELGALFNKKAYGDYIDGMKAALENPAVKGWMRTDCYIGLSIGYAAIGKSDAALAWFDKAVRGGFDNYIVLHEIAQLRSLFSNERFKKIYRSMRISPEANRELQWLKSETLAVIHDMNIMITENMGRMDTDWTGVPKSHIPKRKTRSHGVLTSRALLAWAQQYQTQTVQKSDQSRINHLMQMGIIGNLPTGKFGGMTEEEQRKERKKVRKQKEKIRLSLKQAKERYEARVKAVRNRALSRNPNLSDELGPVPALGSWKSGASGTPNAGVGKDSNPIAKAKVGDWVVYSQTISYGGEIKSATLTYRVTSASNTEIVTTSTTESDGESKTESEKKSLYPTLKEQLVKMLEEEGVVEVLGYSRGKAKYTAGGNTFDVVKVSLQFNWTMQGNASTWTATYYFHPDVPAFGFVRAVVTNGEVTLEQVLTKYGRGK